MRRSLFAIVLLLGVPAPSWAASGGTTYPDAVGGAAYGSPSTSRPTIGRFSVPTRIREGSAPSIRFRVDEPGERAVRVRIAVLPLGSTPGKPLSFEVGRRTVGRVHTVHWHGQGKLAAGRYLVRLHAVDALGRTLLRGAHAWGRATLTVTPRPKPKKKAAPAPAPTPAPTPTPAASTAPPPGPSAPTAPITSGVFPVAGAHSYGEAFGAPRPGYSHQGQDVVAAEGSQVVAPTAGTVS